MKARPLRPRVAKGTATRGGVPIATVCWGDRWTIGARAQVLEAFLRESVGLYVALARALRAPDPRPSLSAAHSLRGAAANAGAIRVRDIAGDIEALARGADYDGAIRRLGELASQVERFRDLAVAELEAPPLRQSGVA
ncbi:MAG: Hpt domain-containing protein [Steroidobacteraceae bacterium]